MRIASLDSLRGIAALIVVASHLRLMYPETPAWIRYSPLRVLIAGESAVTVFFILSGLVLYLALTSRDGGSYWSFATKRFWRIYPPFCVAILISTALWYLVDPAPLLGVGNWATEYSWQVHPTWSVVLAHLAMTDVQAWQSLDNVMWSLVIELRLSLIFPVIAVAVKRDWRVALALGALISGACFYIQSSFSPDWFFNPFLTGKYLYLFVIGAVLAENSSQIMKVSQALSGRARLALWCAALVPFSVNPVHVGGVPTAIGAALLVALSFADVKVRDALTGSIPLWLGKISYSLYLIHVPILIAAAHLLNTTIPMIYILALAAVTALCASEILYRTVERPSLKFGRTMAERLLPRRPLVPA
ncbi:acyltransferase [Bradyrhizobium sp. LjRoot220]|uniref:acyltransferase family protein n=1 Tax=Bradyrhizobium sp. LjRoot220 TaxID=3342284 RepID=UPI003ECFFE1A